MKILKGLLIFVVFAAVAFVGVGLMLPQHSHIERSISVDASPATVYTVLNGFHQFNKWSPWADLDPNTVYTREGPLLGVGASQAWISDDSSVGSGSQEIIEVTPNQQIKIDLKFGGFDSQNLSTYALQPDGTSTRITWSYDSDAGSNLMYRYFGLMTDRMLGPDYEKGLAKLKPLVESLPKTDFSTLQVELIDAPKLPVAYVYAESGIDQAATVIAAAYAKISEFMAANQLQQSGVPLAITHEFNDETMFWKFDAAIPIDRPDAGAPSDSEVKIGTTVAGTSLKVVHRGAYATMPATYAQLLAFRDAAGLEDNGNSSEHYVKDLSDTPEAELVTEIYWPVK